jgi:5'-3' exoribonuclease 1
MEPFDLPTLNGLHLVPGFCDGVLTGAEALAGFPSLHSSSYHPPGIPWCQCTRIRESKQIDGGAYQEPYEDTKTEDIAKEMIGKQTFMILARGSRRCHIRLAIQVREDDCRAR